MGHHELFSLLKRPPRTYRIKSNSYTQMIYFPDPCVVARTPNKQSEGTCAYGNSRGNTQPRSSRNSDQQI